MCDWFVCLVDYVVSGFFIFMSLLLICVIVMWEFNCVSLRCIDVCLNCFVVVLFGLVCD